MFPSLIRLPITTSIGGQLSLKDDEGLRKDHDFPPELVAKVLQCNLKERSVPLVVIHDISKLSSYKLSLWISLNPKRPDGFKYDPVELKSLYSSLRNSIGEYLFARVPMNSAQSPQIKKVELEADMNDEDGEHPSFYQNFPDAGWKPEEDTAPPSKRSRSGNSYFSVRQSQLDAFLFPGGRPLQITSKLRPFYQNGRGFNVGYTFRVLTEDNRISTIEGERTDCIKAVCEWAQTRFKESVVVVQREESLRDNSELSVFVELRYRQLPSGDPTCTEHRNVLSEERRFLRRADGTAGMRSVRGGEDGERGGTSSGSW